MSIGGISSGGSNRPDFSQIQQFIFDQADSNGDGSIASSEFDSMIQNSPRLGKASSSIVTNPDGSKATPDQIFKAVDTDGDAKTDLLDIEIEVHHLQFLREGNFRAVAVVERAAEQFRKTGNHFIGLLWRRMSERGQGVERVEKKMRLQLLRRLATRARVSSTSSSVA